MNQAIPEGFRRPTTRGRAEFSGWQTTGCAITAQPHRAAEERQIEDERMFVPSVRREGSACGANGQPLTGSDRVGPQVIQLLE